MRVLVTGGAGFIGSHLCERLLADGHEVLCLDDLSTGAAGNVAALLERRGFELIRHDVVEPFDFEVDRVFNLACPASPVHYQQDPVKTVKTNVMGAIHALDLCVRTGARLLQASTSEVYGDPAVHPQTEDYHGNVNPIGPRSCYDEGKRVAETLCFDYHRQHGVEIRVARIFNTYGPRMALDDGRVVSSFVVAALRGEDVAVHGDGSQTRSFCFVDDMVEGLVRMMDGGETGPLNLGNPVELPVRDLAELVVELTGSRSRVVARPLPKDDPARRRPDIARARATIGFQPKVDLREGLARTIAWFEHMLRAGGFGRAGETAARVPT